MDDNPLPGLRVDLAERVLEIKRRNAAGEHVSRADIAFLVHLVESGREDAQGWMDEWLGAATEALARKKGDLTNDPELRAALDHRKEARQD
jgi:hypothetical protein